MPKAGGAILFACLAHAFGALDLSTKERVDGLKCVHHWAQSLSNSESRPTTDEKNRFAPPVTNSLIRTHPGNGK